jgi:uncharacterized protein (DUF1330 family)
VEDRSRGRFGNRSQCVWRRDRKSANDGAGLLAGLVNVKDEEGYTKEFLPKVQPLIEEAGGEYVAGGFNKTYPITGEPPPNRVVIIRFEGGLSAIGEWYEKQKSIEKEVGEKYATFQSFAVEGVEPRR